MNRIARSISSSIALVAIATLVMIGLVGCSPNDNPFAPKTMFYGFEKNAVQYRLNVSDPSDQTKIWTLDPTEGFHAEVPGSSVIHSEAHLPDGTLYAVLDARINQVSNDAQVNGVNVDWCWIIGGPFMACVTPVGGGDASQYQVKVSSDSTAVMASAPLVMMVTSDELASVRAAKDIASTVAVVRSIARRHGVSDMSKVLPGYEEVK